MNTATPPLSWGHININVSDLDTAIGFYQKLGFRVLLRGIPYLNLELKTPENPLPAGAAHALGLPAGTRGRGCIMELGSGFPKLDLTEWRSRDRQPPHRNADLGVVRICLASSDLSADYGRLREQGVEFQTPPMPTEGNKADIAVCVDPDGTLIELIQIHLENW